MSQESEIFESVNYPNDLKSLNLIELKKICSEIRKKTIDIVSRTGGHLGANLGVVELTVALHHIFNTPDDKLIWDVGHQSYPHKLLTGRKELMQNLRKAGGASGFTRRSESVYDPFGAAHASTSISAALGFAVGRDLKNNNNHVVAVIGDGAMSAGMAYEAMNNAGAMASRLIVILNDNDMSIAPPVGAMSNYLSRLLSSGSYHYLRQFAKGVASHLPKSIENVAKKAEEFARGMVSGGTLFEELGFYYVGPVDGHNLDHLLPVLKNVKDRAESEPVLLHVVTQKGKGYPPAEASSDKFHGVSKFDVITGIQVKGNPLKSPAYTKVFSDALIDIAQDDKKIVAVTAAMPSGTGLDEFSKKFPERFFDVGIAEQHAVTFAAGLACEGFKPFVAIYSTFMQRAYDQIIHDVILQKLPVRFILDRAGLVGADGATHAGSYDLSYLCCLPNIIVMAPSDENELKNMVFTSSFIDDIASAIRFPRGDGLDVEIAKEPTLLEIGKARILKEGSKIAIIALGCRVKEALIAADHLKNHGLSTTVVDARFAKPIDEKLIADVAKNHEILITIESGSIGGFSAQVSNFLSENGFFDNGLKFRSMVLPDLLIDHDTPENQYEKAKLSANDIVNKVFSILGKSSKVMSLR
jgi:1-deoxy-D-xylulose-5-phosphate synthase